MLNHFQHHDLNTRRVLISKSNAVRGPRIGGKAPDGIVPPQIFPSTRYFVTAPLDKLWDREVSLFTSFDYGVNFKENPIYKNISRVLSSEDFVQIVVHTKSNRGTSTLLASELPGRALEIQDESPDIVVPPGGELLLPNKMGGTPYYYYGTQSYIDAHNRLFAQGFVLFLQLTWGGYERAAPFLSPFGDYTFHLLAKEGHNGLEWRYGWG